MANPAPITRWHTDGKFFRLGPERATLRAVTYGPFPGSWPRSFAADFKRIAGAGFNALRLYELPSKRLLEAAGEAGLSVFGGLQWEQHADFVGKPSRLSAAKIELAESLGKLGEHPSWAGVYVGNEIPADLVRWMQPAVVQHALEDLIELGRDIAPQLLFAYANYPSTEYLEPGNADFTAFNIYLEDEAAFRRYLRRLHHIAGDRPLVISEFGLDSQRNGTERQAELLVQATRIARDEETAGFTTYAWSDRWLSGGSEVADWDFGITDRKGNDKPALKALTTAHQEAAASNDDHVLANAISVIVCTRNGRERIGPCLKAIESSAKGNDLQIIVVDDGSTDGTADYVAEHHPRVELHQIESSGLSAARNAGAAIARTDILAFTDDDCEPDRDWLKRVVHFLETHPEHAAVGGPNLPQQPTHWREAVVCSAPGAPSHVMLDDTTAEHLPGCNLVVRKTAFDAIGGFDKRFHAAGDDVDFCWRLQDEGFTLGFDPGAFVWHWRRPTLRAYLRQQIGYGKAERMLITKHPQRFNARGSARWKGFIYGGAPVRVSTHSIIYHGEMGLAGYQSLLHGMQPLRDIHTPFNHWKSRAALMLISWLAPALRGWFRSGRLRALLPQWPAPRPGIPGNPSEILSVPHLHREQLLNQLLAGGWSPCGSTEVWDVQKDGTRLQLATELGEMGTKRTLVRVEGDDSEVRAMFLPTR